MSVGAAELKLRVSGAAELQGRLSVACDVRAQLKHVVGLAKLSLSGELKLVGDSLILTNACCWTSYTKAGL